MSDFTVHTLLTTPLIEVRDVICAGTCRHKGATERAGRMQLVFPYRGTYVRHVGADEVVADASQVLFFHAGEDYQVSHPNRRRRGVDLDPGARPSLCRAAIGRMTRR